MSATAPHPRTVAPGDAGALPLAAALLLALSGVLALPAGLLSTAYHADSWAVAAAAGPASVLPTLVLVAAAVVHGSTVLLLVTSAVTVLHLVGLFTLASMAVGGPVSPLVLVSGEVQLGLAVVALLLAWWDGTRTRRRPGIALALVTLSPVVGLFVDLSTISGDPWWIVGAGMLLLHQLPVLLTVLAAGLVCLPGRGARITAAVVAGLAGLVLVWAGSLLGPSEQPSVLRYAVLAVAVLCALATAVRTAPAEPPAEPPAATPAEPHDVVPGRALVEVSGAVPVPALAVLVLTVALAVPALFVQGPGIRPDGAGLLPLAGLLAVAGLPTALTLTAGAVALRSRRVLVVASVVSGLLALGLVGTWAGGRPPLPHDALALVALGLALALAWSAERRPAADGMRRWVAALPLLLAMTATAPVLAAVLLGVPRRAARVAAAALLAVLAVVALDTMLDDISGLRLQAVLNLLRVCGYGLACVLAVVPSPRRYRGDVAVGRLNTTSAQL